MEKGREMNYQKGQAGGGVIVGAFNIYALAVSFKIVSLH